jgi:hypothetical protein
MRLKKYLTGDICKKYGVTRMTVKMWREKGLPYKRASRSKIYYNPMDVVKWVYENRGYWEGRALSEYVDRDLFRLVVDIPSGELHEYDDKTIEIDDELYRVLGVQEVDLLFQVPAGYSRGAAVFTLCRLVKREDLQGTE